MLASASSSLDSGGEDLVTGGLEFLEVDDEESSLFFDDILDCIPNQSCFQLRSGLVSQTMTQNTVGANASESDDELSSYLSGPGENNSCRTNINIPEKVLKVQLTDCLKSNTAQNGTHQRSQVLARSNTTSPSDSDQVSFGRSLCMNQNAIAARENRRKKKQYVDELETKIDDLGKSNAKLEEKVKRQGETISDLTREVTYLRNVLANQSGLSALLANIQNTPGMKFTSSLNTLTSQQDNNSPLNPTCGLKRNLQSIENQENINGSDNIHVPAKKLRSNQVMTSSSTSPASREEEASAVGHNVDVSMVEGIVPSHASSNSTTGGVCLHVSNNNVSVELCSHCASNAAQSWKLAASWNKVKSKSVGKSRLD